MSANLSETYFFVCEYMHEIDTVIITNRSTVARFSVVINVGDHAHVKITSASFKTANNGRTFTIYTNLPIKGNKFFTIVDNNSGQAPNLRHQLTGPVYGTYDFWLMSEDGGTAVPTFGADYYIGMNLEFE